MKLFIAFFILLFSFKTFSQIKGLQLKNAIIIGQLDKSDDRYSVEIALTEILTNAGVKALPSLNFLKVGSDTKNLANDSIQKEIASKGIDTYMTVSVRGFDKKFKKAKNRDNLMTSLTTGHLFPLFRDEIVSISFEFTFYREGQFIATDIVKCGNVSSRDTVLKRFKKKMTRRVNKWIK